MDIGLNPQRIFNILINKYSIINIDKYLYYSFI